MLPPTSTSSCSFPKGQHRPTLSRPPKTRYSAYPYAGRPSPWKHPINPLLEERLGPWFLQQWKIQVSLKHSNRPRLEKTYIPLKAAQRAIFVYTVMSFRVGSFLGSPSRREWISSSSALIFERGHSLNLWGFLVQGIGNLNRAVSSKKYEMTSRQTKTLKNCSLNFLYEVVKELKSMLPNRMISECHRTGSTGWEV